MKQRLKQYLKGVGAFDVGIASPLDGYEKALKGYSPVEVWPECKSWWCLQWPMSPEANNTYVEPYAPHKDERPLGPVPVQLQSVTHAMCPAGTIPDDKLIQTMKMQSLQTGGASMDLT